MTLCCWPCPIFGALPCRMPCCQPCNQKCINQWPAEPFADFLVMASRHGLAGGLLHLQMGRLVLTLMSLQGDERQEPPSGFQVREMTLSCGLNQVRRCHERVGLRFGRLAATRTFTGH